MERWMILLFILLMSFKSVAFDSCIPRADLFSLKPLQEMTVHHCDQVKKSPECQNVYTKMKENGVNPQEKALQCDVRSKLLSSQPTDFTMGCALGGWNIVKDLGEALGEGAGKLVLEIQNEKNEEALCDKDPAKKKALYTDFNVAVPRMLQVPVPTDAVFSNMSCARLKAGLQTTQRRQALVAMDQVRGRVTKPDAKFTAEEQEYVNWIKKINTRTDGGDFSLVQMAKEHLKEMGVKLECYNTVHAAALLCEAVAHVALTVAAPSAKALSALRLKNISKLSGLKVSEFVEDVNAAGRTTAGVGGKLVSDAEKARILEAAGSMTKEERILAFEKLAGRKLTSEEADQFWKIHEVGDGRGYFELTKQDLKEKLEAATRQINPATGKPYFTPEEADVALRNGLWGGFSQKEKEAFYIKYKTAAEKFGDYSYHRLHAESAGALGKTEEASAAYRKSYEAFVKSKKLELQDAASARQSLVSLSERELTEIENLAANSGNTARLQEITKAKWNATEKDLRNRYRNQPGFSEALSNQVQQSYENLRVQTYSSNPILKKAAEEKIQALKAAYPGLK